MRSIIALFVFSMSTIQLSAQDKKELFLADPSIYTAKGKYYLTGTGGGQGVTPGFYILESKDLKTWAPPTGPSETSHMILRKGDQAFGETGFWAPQILKEKDTYYLTYTANEQTVIAQSKSLLGPYKQTVIAPIDGSAKNIDSYIFKDDDGKFYLYHVRFNKGNFLWVAEFDLEKGTIKPETLKKCFDNTEPWETTPNYPSSPIMEGPTVMKLNKKYYLFYSANHYRNIDYAVGYAVSDSPTGPWLKQKDSPIIHRTIVGDNGSGHGDFFAGPKNQLYYVYHVHNGKDLITPRKTRIVPVTKRLDRKTGMYKFSVDGSKVIVPEMADR